MIKIKRLYFTNSSSNLFKYLLQRGSFCQSFGVRMGMHTGDLSRVQNPSYSLLNGDAEDKKQS